LNPQGRVWGVAYRILSVGTDLNLLATRHSLLASRGYDPLIATPDDVDEKLQANRFDLVILSAMLSEEDKRRIQAELPAGTRLIVLRTIVWPDELLRMLAEAFASDTADQV
jgi:PleD family two-component response regulator